MKRIERYIALGDSISIDLYPALDEAGRGPSDPGRLRSGLGAASLLYANDDAVWPEFRGRDLRSLHPGARCRNDHRFTGPARLPSDNLSVDGATTGEVLSEQIPHVEAAEEATLITLTAGGNDLLAAMGLPAEPPGLVPGICDRLGDILHALRRRRPNALVLLGTVYDPSDGTDDLGGGRLEREARWLAALNAGIRALAASASGVHLADIHRHFLGHGVTAPVRERWYWSGLIFEPSARGASEVRRVWLDCLASWRNGGH